MIVRPRPPFWQLFFVLRGSIVPRILPHLAAIALLSVTVVCAYRLFPSAFPTISGAPLTIVGIAISVFLAFRNNVSYDRWWEARRLWGQLIHLSRTFSRQTLLLAGEAEGSASHRADVLRPVGRFASSMVDHLRGPRPTPAGGEDPSSILSSIGEQLAFLRRSGAITDIEYQILDRSISEMDAVLAGCERIRNTPVPLAYSLLMHRTAYLFCFFFPFGFTEVLGWATPVVATLIAYTFFGLGALGDELEEPFGLEPNDLPIASMANAIARTIAEELGDEVPPTAEPVNFVLN